MDKEAMKSMTFRERLSLACLLAEATVFVALTSMAERVDPFRAKGKIPVYGFPPQGFKWDLVEENEHEHDQ